MVGYITVAHGAAQRLSEKWRHFAFTSDIITFCTSLLCVGVRAGARLRCLWMSRPGAWRVCCIAIFLKMACFPFSVCSEPFDYTAVIKRNQVCCTSWQRTFRGGVDELALFRGVAWLWLLGTSPSRRGILSRRRQLGAPAPEVDLRRGDEGGPGPDRRCGSRRSRGYKKNKRAFTCHPFFASEVLRPRRRSMSAIRLLTTMPTPLPTSVLIPLPTTVLRGCSPR